MQDLWSNIKHENLHIIRVSEGEEREKMQIQPSKISGTQQSYSNGIGTKADIYINGTEYRDNKYTQPQTIYDRRGNNIQWRKDTAFNMFLGNLDSYMYKQWNRNTLSYYEQK